MNQELKLKEEKKEGVSKKVEKAENLNSASIDKGEEKAQKPKKKPLKKKEASKPLKTDKEESAQVEKADKREEKTEDKNSPKVIAPKIEVPKVVLLNDLHSKSLQDQMDLAAQLNVVKDPASFKGFDLVVKICRKYMELGSLIKAEGVLDVLNEGHGFLRFSEINYTFTQFDVFIPGQKIRKWNLKGGDVVLCSIRPPKDNEKYFSVSNLELTNGDSKSVRHRVNFENLTPIYPDEKINFELENGSSEDISLRICDLMVPIGFGQRALIIAQPRAGKTILMQNMAHAITKNHPEVYLMVLLIDERPEEVTDMKRSVKGEVISSTFDEPAARHIQIAEIAIEKAKRLVENGKNVVLFLDSITRLARAYNTVMPSSGKILTGGIDASAMEGPKRIFGSARNTEEKGSLTIIGTALDKNKSQMDYYILQEFAGTGNCEIYLDKALADKRVYPALEITTSGTRNEDRFFKTETEMQKRWAIRRVVIPMGASAGIEFLTSRIKASKNNADLFKSMNS